MPNTIHTERLTLRQPTLDDAPALVRHFSDWDVVKMTGTIPHPYVPMSADFWILRIRAQQRRGLALSYMLETSGGDVIGNVTLFRPSETDSFEIGYHIGRDAWGQGYATEAVQAVLDMAASTGQRRIVAGVYDDNPASRHLLHKFGFQQEEADSIFCMSRQCRVPGHRYSLTLDAEASVSNRKDVALSVRDA